MWSQTTKKIPSATPWGWNEKTEAFTVQGQEFLFANTPGHGGIFVDDAQFSLLPDYIKAKAADTAGRWYEEDCAAPLVIWYIVRLTATAMTAAEAEHYGHLVDAAMFWYPEIFERVTGERVPFAKRGA